MLLSTMQQRCCSLSSPPNSLELCWVSSRLVACSWNVFMYLAMIGQIESVYSQIVIRIPVLASTQWAHEILRARQISQGRMFTKFKFKFKMVILGCPVVDHLAITTRIDNIGKLYGQRLTYLHNLQRVYCMQNCIKPQSQKKYWRNSDFYNSWSTCHPTWRRVR